MTRDFSPRRHGGAATLNTFAPRPRRQPKGQKLPETGPLRTDQQTEPVRTDQQTEPVRTDPKDRTSEDGPADGTSEDAADRDTFCHLDVTDI